MAEQEWSHNLCSMDSCSSCCGTIWCSLCIYGRTAWRLERYPQDPSSSSGFEWCNAPCLGMFAGWLLLIPCVPVWMQRNVVRKRFNLPGNGCTDCLVSVFCGCCAQVQHENELKERAEEEMLMIDHPPTGRDRMVYAEPAGIQQPATNQQVPPPRYESADQIATMETKEGVETQSDIINKEAF
ncbi:hypothetical protein VTO58DRAFT_110187 [Aureobasidium pullulans]